MPREALGLQTERPLRRDPPGTLDVAALFHRFRHGQAGVLAQAVVHRVARVDQLDHAVGRAELLVGGRAETG